MRLAVVIILVIALTILLFEEALSRISRPKLKQKVKRLKVSRPKTKLSEYIKPLLARGRKDALFPQRTQMTNMSWNCGGSISIACLHWVLLGAV
ncbi:hypothetical protein MTO96_050849 [Rhipicephalus appendiculatus]